MKATDLPDGDGLKDRVELRIHPEAMRLIETPGRGVLIVSGHLGNWEIGSRVAARYKPVAAIARDMKNPRVNELMKRREARRGIRTIPKRGSSAKQLLGSLRRGEMLAILIDQYARDHRMMIPFLGRPAATYVTPAVLHLATGAPIAFAHCVRTGLMRYTLTFDEPIVHPRSGDRRRDTRAILETLNSKLGKAIRAYPEQYLWAHRRWRQEDLPRSDRHSDGEPPRP
jgi:KDO2-lipid IV(A) lauroyltransferase